MISERKRNARQNAGLTVENIDYKTFIKPIGLTYVENPKDILSKTSKVFEFSLYH